MKKNVLMEFLLKKCKTLNKMKHTLLKGFKLVAVKYQIRS